MECCKSFSIIETSPEIEDAERYVPSLTNSCYAMPRNAAQQFWKSTELPSLGLSLVHAHEQRAMLARPEVKALFLLTISWMLLVEMELCRQRSAIELSQLDLSKLRKFSIFVTDA